MSGVLDGLRIGELEQRVGVSSHTLRAWERRYGLLNPARSTGGYRLYSPADERRVRAVIALRNKGISAEEACRRVLAEERQEADATGESSLTALPTILAELAEAVQSFDERRAHDLVDVLVREYDFDTVVREGLMPFLTEVGERWERGELSVAHEHFASHLVRRRLSALSLTWAGGAGPLALLACPPGERHDIPLLVLGLLLARAGWRVRFLGQDTPLPALAAACRQLRPQVVVLSATRSSVFHARLSGLRRLAATQRVVLAGRGATPELGDLLSAEVLTGDVLDGARHLTAGVTS